MGLPLLRFILVFTSNAALPSSLLSGSSDARCRLSELRRPVKFFLSPVVSTPFVLSCPRPVLMEPIYLAFS